MRGNLTQLGPDRWRLRVYVGRVDGKPVLRSKVVRGGKRAAQAQLRRFIEEVNGSSVVGHETTVAVLIERWWEIANVRLSPNTLRAYRRYIDSYILPTFGETKLPRLLPEHLDAWYAKLAKKLAPASIHQLHSILNSAFTQAVKWRWLSESPVRLASPPPVVRRNKAPMTVEDLQKLLSNSIDSLHMAIELGALTGARRAELCALRHSDVMGGVVHIARSLVYKDGKWVEGPTKTHADRFVACSLKLPVPQNIEHFILGNGFQPWSPDGLSNAFWKLCKRLGMDYTFHDLRHFSVTQLIAAGVDARTVATRHGHSSVNTTLNIYAQVVRERDAAAASVISQLVAGPQSVQ